MFAHGMIRGPLYARRIGPVPLHRWLTLESGVLIANPAVIVIRAPTVGVSPAYLVANAARIVVVAPPLVSDFLATVEMELSPGTWTTIEDVIIDEGIAIAYGIAGNRPKDRVASTGTASFTLRNDDGNSGSTEGWYSPNRTGVVRSGFGYGTPVRIVFQLGPAMYYKFRGKLAMIDPVPGREGRRVTRCEAVDWIDEAAATTVRDIGAQEGQRADELVTALVAAMPTAAQPVTTVADTGNQAFPYALHDLGSGEAALRVLAKIVQSEWGYAAVIGDQTAGGTLRVWNRHARASADVKTALDETVTDVRVPTTLSNVYNQVEVTTHPLRIDDTATTVLFQLPTTPISVRPLLPPGVTRTFSLEYRDPDSDDTLIGALDGVALVEGTDYRMNLKADESGTDVSSDCTATATFYASTATVAVTNNGTVHAYLTHLQGRGRGVYDRTPQVLEASSTQSYGERRIAIDQPYQADPNFGQGLADMIDVQYRTLANQIDSVRFVANRTNTLLMAAIQCEPGDKITVTETQTGLSAVSAFIQQVRLGLQPGNLLAVEWGLAPDVEGDYFQLDVDTLDSAATLGYF